MFQPRTTELILTPDALVARLKADRIDFYSINQIERIIHSPLAAMFQMPIVLDLSNVGVTPRLVMQALYRALQKLKEDQGQRFILAGLNEDEGIQGDITWFRLCFEMYSSVDEALDYLSRYSWRRYRPPVKVKRAKPEAEPEAAPTPA